jgi:hypothetical protein
LPLHFQENLKMKKHSQKESNSKNQKPAGRLSPALESRIKKVARDPVLVSKLLNNSKRLGRMPEPKLGLDLHETLHNFMKSFGEYIAEGRMYQGRQFEASMIRSQIWNFAQDPASGMNSYEFNDEFADYSCLDRGGFSDLELISAKIPAMLKSLARKGRDNEKFTIYLWTDVPAFNSLNGNTGQWLESDSARYGTFQLLKRDGILDVSVAHENVHFLKPMDKVKAMIENDVWLFIDDKPSTAAMVSEVGRVCLIPRHEFNRGYENVPRIVYLDSIEQMENAVRLFFNEIKQVLKENEAVTGKLLPAMPNGLF